MKKSFILLFLLLLFFTGCKGSKNEKIISGNVPIDLINPNGAYEITLYNALNLAVKNMDFSKYSGKKVLLSIETDNDYYISSIFKHVVEYNLSVNKAIIVNEDNTEFEYILKYNTPVCGIHESTSIFKDKITGMVVIDLLEKNSKGKMNSYTSGLVKYEYEDFIFNQYLLTFIWILPIFILLVFLTIFKYKK